MKKLVLTLAIAGISMISFGQVDRSIRPKAGPAPELQIKDPQVFTLNNGLKVILSENHKLPTVAIYYNSPSDYVLEGEKAGTADLLGELMLAGTKERSKDQFDKEKDFIGLTIFASANQLYIQTLKKHLDKATELFTDALYNPTFPQDEIDRVKKKKESELTAGKSDPGFMASNVTKKLIYGENNPLGEIMTEATLENITRDDFVATYKRMFTPKGGYLTIVGDMTLAEAKAYAEKNFANWTGAEPYKASYTTVANTQGNRVIFVNKRGAVQSKIMIAYPLDIKKGDKNDLDFSVTNIILGGHGFAGRFMQNLREDKAYTYGAYSNVTVGEYGSYFVASGDFRNDVTDSAITQFIYEFNRITDELVTDAELEETKAMMTGNFARSLQSASTFASFAHNIFKYNLPEDYYKTYLKRLDAVTKEDVLDAAQKFINPKKLMIIVVGNEDILDRLKAFDADGNIEKMDAYGDPVKEMKPADITKEQLIEKYVLLNTKSSTMAEAQKKLKKVKSMKTVTELTTPQVPMPITLTQFYAKPNKTGMTMEIQGMTMQKTYFDGKKGGQFVMQQGSKEMTAEEVAEAKSNVGILAEANYFTNGTDYELLGIENQNGADYYVIKRTSSKGETYDYYDMDGQKWKSTSIVTAKNEKGEDETQEITNTFGDFKEVNGFIFAHKMSMNIGPMSLSGVVKSIELNGKIDKSVFVK